MYDKLALNSDVYGKVKMKKDERTFNLRNKIWTNCHEVQNALLLKSIAISP